MVMRAAPKGRQKLSGRRTDFGRNSGNARWCAEEAICVSRESFRPMTEAASASSLALFSLNGGLYEEKNTSL